MTIRNAGSAAALPATTVDLRRAALGEVRAVDLRASERDLWAPT